MQLTQETRAERQTESQGDWQGPLFAVGMWRSGTSLLFALMNKHPQIGLMYEGDLSLLRPLFWIRRAERKWLERWEFWNEAPKRHELESDSIPSGAFPLRTAMQSVYQLYAEQKKASIWGDKSPNYHDCLSRLAREFPDARFLIIWRDPSSICRSVVSAAKENAWWGRPGMSHRTLMGYKRMKTECDRLLQRGTRVYQIHYETLVRDPITVMSAVCKFLDVPFVRAMASLDGADRSAIYEGKHHTLVNGERIVSSLDRSEVLSPRLKKKIERYVCMWREQTNGEWPVVLNPPMRGCKKPSALERAFDEIVYRYFRALDTVVIFVYCFAPLGFLKKFRAARRRAATERTSKLKGAQHSK